MPFLPFLFQVSFFSPPLHLPFGAKRISPLSSPFLITQAVTFFFAFAAVAGAAAAPPSAISITPTRAETINLLAAELIPRSLRRE